MAERRKVLPRPLFRRDVNWDPFRDWAQPSRLFDQDFGLPPFLEPGDLSWIDWAHRRASTSSWPGYTLAPLFTPTDGPTSPSPPSPQLRHHIGGVSEIRTGPDSWKISLDVSHFSPKEITIRTKEGYLEIAGKHEEKQDEHGFVSRSFTRKYKIPPAVDLQHISSSLSRDGVLAVVAPLPPPATMLPQEIVIPIQVEEEEPSTHSEWRPDKRAKAEAGKEAAPSAREWQEGCVTGEEKPQSEGSLLQVKEPGSPRGPRPHI